MKYTLIALLIVLSPICTLAQKHNLLADVATPLGGAFPGFSVTYNYNPAKWFSVGAGLQGYRFYPTSVNARKFVPAAYADIRFNIRAEKRNSFFSFMELGIDLYTLDENYYRNSTSISHVGNNGFYSGLGFGYLHHATKRGGGPYASLKMILNWYTLNDYSVVSEEQDIELLSAHGTLALSVGFKF